MKGKGRRRGMSSNLLWQTIEPVCYRKRIEQPRSFPTFDFPVQRNPPHFVLAQLKSIKRILHVLYI